jgi:hypothetical protein
MRLLRLTKTRGWALGALTAAVSLGVTLGLATPARAALSGSDWIMKKLPARYTDGISQGPGAPSVSCVPGTRFCLAIVGDTKNLVNGGVIGQAALVTRNAGRTWTGHATLPSAFLVDAVSCATTEVCWVTGTTWATGGPAVAESTDGGRHWTDLTPASWANVPWWASAIDCVSATTCWLAGTTGPAQNPAVAETTDGGATWTVFGNLPAVSATPIGTYELSGISCLSADSCVAVGGLNGGSGPARVISTTDGGATWSLSTSAGLSGIQQLLGVSCLPAAGGSTTCYAGGVAYPPGSSVAESVVLISPDDGATWSQAGGFNDNGWFSSISCASAQNCWAAGAGSTDALVGTGDGGASWSVVTSDTSNEEGSVSCLDLSTCVAITDGGLWVTSDDGGLVPTG